MYYFGNGTLTHSIYQNCHIHYPEDVDCEPLHDTKVLQFTWAHLYLWYVALKVTHTKWNAALRDLNRNTVDWR